MDPFTLPACNCGSGPNVHVYHLRTCPIWHLVEQVYDLYDLMVRVVDRYEQNDDPRDWPAYITEGREAIARVTGK